MMIIENHSWNGITTHILRSNGKVFRAKLGSITLKPHGIYIHVSFIHKNKPKSKEVDLLSIPFLHLLWLNVDVVSDNETSESDIDLRYIEQITTECSRVLPSLVIEEHSFDRLDQHAKDAMLYTKMQIDNILHLSSMTCPEET